MLLYLLGKVFSFHFEKIVIIEMQVLLKHPIMMLLLHPAVFYYHICQLM